MEFDNVILREEQRMIYLLNEFYYDQFFDERDMKLSYVDANIENGYYVHKENGIWILESNFEEKEIKEFTNFYNLLDYILSLWGKDLNDLTDYVVFPPAVSAPRGTRVVVREANEKDVVMGTVINIPESVLDDEYKVLGDDGKEYNCIWINKICSYDEEFLLMKKSTSKNKNINACFRTIEDYINNAKNDLIAYLATQMDGNIINDYIVADLKGALSTAIRFKDEYMDSKTGKTK